MADNGIKTIIIGPGDIAHAHGRKEHVKIDEVRQQRRSTRRSRSFSRQHSSGGALEVRSCLQYADEGSLELTTNDNQPSITLHRHLKRIIAILKTLSTSKT